MPRKLQCISDLLAIPLRFGLCVFLASVSTVLAERLPVKTYTVADGLLRDNVYKIKQDSRGFLWFCTGDGISRFDGYAFRNFTTADGLPERHVNDFLESRKGDIWLGTDAGLVKLNPTGIANSKENPLFTVIVPDDQKAKSIQVLFEDESGAIWVGSNNGLYELTEGSHLRAVDLGIADRQAETMSIASIIRDRQGAMWIGMKSGISRIRPDGTIDRFTMENGLPGTNVSVLYEDRHGRIWAGFRAGRAAGLVLLATDPSTIRTVVERHYTEKDGLPGDWITDLRETSDGKFWVGTTGGLCEWQGSENSVCKTYKTRHDLCDREIWAILEDTDRNLWLGSRCGTKKWARYGFTSYHETDGIDNPLANSIFENSAGELFVSFNNGNDRSLGRFDGDKFKLIRPRFSSHIKYFGWGWKQTVWQDRTGDWWFPTGGGLVRYSKPALFEALATATPAQIQVGKTGNEIFRFFEDSRGDIWIATTGVANELWHLDRTANIWRDLTAETGLTGSRVVTAFIEDQAGNLWIATGSDQANSALVRYRNGDFTVFDQANNELLSGWLRDLLVDRQGRLWIASTEAGLLRLDDVNAQQLKFVRYTPAEGLSSIAVSCVTDDAFGRIYIGTGRGLDRLTPETGQIENFTTADGLPSSYVDVAYRDRHDTLWFGTADGLARLVPEPERTRQLPNVLITGLRVNGEPRAVSILGETAVPALELDAAQRQVTVDFLGLGASLGEKLRYEFRLGESDWTPTNERTVNFANLDSDSYRFEVRAITADRLYSQPATFAFRVAAPLWQRWWFIGGLVALTAFAIYALYRYRLEQLLEFERMRTRIATDLHDDIGSNLTRIALLSEVANQRTAAIGDENLLPSIADIARESVASMNDIVWAISPEHDSLLDLTRRMRLHAEDVFSYRNVDVEFQAPFSDNELRLSVGVRRDLLLIFKEAISNAAKHSDCARVWIDFYFDDAVLSLNIKDNGKGFDVAAENDGNGVQSMTRRAAAMGGELTIDSRVGEGTSVNLAIRSPNRS